MPQRTLWLYRAMQFLKQKASIMYTVWMEMRKKKVKVTLGTKTDAYTQITSGLKEGDVVYVQD